MATLTEVSQISKKIIKWGIIMLVIISLIPGILAIINKVYLVMNPPPPPPPTVKYGKLPPLVFPQAAQTATPAYTLQTISGSLPSLPNVSKVYPVGVNKSRLLELQRMTDRAKIFGMINDPIQLNDVTYRFTNPRAPIDMVYNVITGGISYRYDWTIDTTIYSNFNVPDKQSAVKEARSFLDRMGVLPADLANGDSNVIYLAATASAMVPALSSYEANFVRVDLFRAEKDEKIPGVGQTVTMKFVTAGGDTSPVNVIISGVDGDGRIVQANYYYSQILGDDWATYPLKSVQNAWKELTSGGGYIAKRTAQTQVTIRHVTMAYYESSQQQDFIQPVYVFDGDQGFMAYVSAIDPNWIETSTSK